MRNTKLALLIGMIAAGVFCIYFFSNIVYLFVIASVIAFILNPLARGLSKKLKIKKALAIFIVYIFIVLVITLILSIIIPNIAQEVKNLSNNMSTYTDNINSYYDIIADKMEQLQIPTEITEKIYELVARLETFLKDFAWKAASSLVGSTLRILDVIIVITISIYLILDTRIILHKVSDYLPRKIGKRFNDIAKECNDVTWKYLKSKTIIALGMAITTFIVLTIIGVEYAFLLAVIAFLLDYIPYFGSIIAGIISAGVAVATGSVTQMIAVLICVLIIQQIEGNIVVPKVQGESVGLHPLLVIFAILACNKLWGPLGMFIAVPLGSIIKIIFKQLYSYVISPD